MVSREGSLVYSTGAFCSGALADKCNFVEGEPGGRDFDSVWAVRTGWCCDFGRAEERCCEEGLSRAPWLLRGVVHV